ncbi:MAG: hypothetical protein KAS97_09200, partial [Candidatus Aminicenantes bacterium]|nr:hypothetical protein [Candidatus Aminicenantes bacterium]
MKTRSLTFITIIVLSVFLICSISLNSQTIKKIEKLKVKKIEAVKSPLVLKATIGMILQDVGPVHIIEVNGQNMGEPQGNRKIFLGNQEGNVRNWYNNYIELSFPDSPVLGKRIPFVIKTGNITISNTRLKSLRAYLEDCTPTSI